VVRGQTVAAFARAYLRDGELQRNKPSVLDAKRTILRKHLLPVLGAVPLRQISAKHVQAVVARCATRKLSAKTVNNILTVLRKLLRLAVDFGLLERTPVIRQLRVETREMAFFDRQDMRHLRDAARTLGPRYAALLLLGAHAGLRRAEIMGLQWEDVDWKDKSILVRRSRWGGQTIPTKTWRERRVPMTDDLQRILRRVKHCSEWVLTRRDGSPLTAQSVKTWFRKLQMTAGLPPEAGVHRLRHTFCSNLAMAGAPLIVIKNLAGHATLQTTQRYMHSDGRAAKAAIALLK